MQLIWGWKLVDPPFVITIPRCLVRILAQAELEWSATIYTESSLKKMIQTLLITSD